jgi:hypothetical protein
MPNAKHKEKVKETFDVLKDCREVLTQILVKFLLTKIRNSTFPGPKLESNAFKIIFPESLLEINMHTEIKKKGGGCNSVA